MTSEAYENYIHNIYKKHYKHPISYEEWSNLIKQLQTSEYKLKYRDNLWDLSGQFLQNNLLWSKLWVANHKINNPHRIKKGNSIKFNLDKLKEVHKSKYSVDIRSQFPNVVIPDPVNQKKSLSEAQIPSSLPYIKQNILLNNLSDFEFNLTRPSIITRIPIPFYLTNNPPQSEGFVKSKDSFGKQAFNGEDIIISYNGDVRIGGIYTVFKNKKSLSSFFDNLFSLPKGDEIDVKGSIRLMGYLKGSDSLYRARVLSSMKPIEINDSIRDGDLKTYTFFHNTRQGNAEGQIIGSPLKKKAWQEAQSIVYLDQGSDDNVNVGDIFYVKLSDKNSKKEDYQYSQPVLGQIQVIHASQNSSTAIVLTSRGPIRIGDIFTASSDISDIKDSEYFENREEPELDSDEEEDLEELEGKDAELDEELEDELDEEEDLEEEEEKEAEEEEEEEAEEETETKEKTKTKEADEDKDPDKETVPSEVVEEFEDLEDIEDIED